MAGHIPSKGMRHHLHHLHHHGTSPPTSQTNDAYEDAAILRMGDTISLLYSETPAEGDMYSEGSGYLYSEGFVDTSCKLLLTGRRRKIPKAFPNCIFRIVPRYKYDAHGQLNEMLERLSRNRASIGRDRDSRDRRDTDPDIHLPDPADRDLNFAEEQDLEELQQTESAEQNENVSEFLRMAGKPITYGQVVQLMQVQSNKFVTITVKEVAELEKHCLRVVLDDTGNDGSAFVLSPRYKVRSEGEYVHMGDQIMLVSKKYNMFLHVSVLHFSGGGLREVNASPQSTSWRVVSYAPYLPDADRYLKAGDVVALFHKECEGYLTKELVEDELLGTEKEDRVFLEIVRGEDKSKRKNSNSLWMIEKKDSNKGGIATYDTLYRFRHLATGHYLAAYVETEESKNKDNKSSVLHSPYVSEFEAIMSGRTDIQCKLTAIKDHTSTATLFAIHPFTRGPEGPIMQDHYICLRHANTGCWLHSMRGSGPLLDDIAHPRITYDEASRPRLMLFATPKLHDEDVFAIIPIPQHERENVQKGVGQVSFLQQCANFGEGWDKTLAISKKVIAILTELIISCSTSGDDNPLTREGIPHEAQQDLLTQQNVIDVIMELLKHTRAQPPVAASSSLNASRMSQSTGFAALHTSSFSQSSASLFAFSSGLQSPSVQTPTASPFVSPQHSSRPVTPNHSETRSASYASYMVSRLAYKLMRQVLRGNSAARDRMAPYISVIQGQIGAIPEATDTLLELFRDNRRLLDSLTDDQIFFFILFLQEKGRDPSFIKFLSVLCSCQNAALPRNQNFILQKLVEERPDLLIPMTMDDEKVFVQSKTPEGERWVPIFQYTNGVDQSRLQYFALSIELFSNLCLGSNSRAISVISKLAPYELVQSVIRNSEVTPHLRASFCDLLLNMYVRNKPQKNVSFVNYTRLWIDLKAGALSIGDKIGEQDFSYIKQFIFAYLQDTNVQTMAQWSANKLTLSVVVLTRHLMALGHFQSDEIKALLKPLTVLLDGRTDVAANSNVAKAIAARNPKMMNAITEEFMSRSNSWEIEDPAAHGIKSRYEKTDFSVLIMEAKLNVCMILDMICDYRLDLRLTELLLIFKQKMEAGKKPAADKTQNVSVNSIEARIEELFHLLDLDERRGYVPVLLDLVLYEHQELAANAAHLLVRHYSQRAELIKALQQVQILVSYKNVTTYQTVQHRVDELRRLTNAGGTGAGGYSDDEEDDQNQMEEQIIIIIRELTALCKDESSDSLTPRSNRSISPALTPGSAPVPSVPPLATTAGPYKYTTGNFSSSFYWNTENTSIMNSPYITNLEHQRILHNQGVHYAVIDLLRLWATSNCYELFLEAFEFLTHFCAGNTENQQALFVDIDFFLSFLQPEEGIKKNSHMGDVFSQNMQLTSTSQDAFLRRAVPGLCIEIFRNNRAICSQITEYQIRKIVNSITDVGKCPQFISILETIVIVNGRPLRRNQNLVMKLITEKQHDLLVLFNEPESVHQRNTLIKANEHIANPESILNFHMTLVDLIVKCCRGKIYEAEIKCQSLYSLHDLYLQFKDPTNLRVIKLLFVRLLEEVYFETERKSENIDLDPTMWQILELFLHDVRTIFRATQAKQQRLESKLDDKDDEEKSATDISRKKYVYETIIPFLTKYFEIHFPRDRAGVTHMRVANEALELSTALFASLTKLSLGGHISPHEEAMRLTVAKCVISLQTATISTPATTSRTAIGMTPGQDSPHIQPSLMSPQARIAHIQPLSTGKYVVGMGNMILQDEIRSVLTKQTKNSASPSVSTKTISKEESVLGGLKIFSKYFHESFAVDKELVGLAEIFTKELNSFTPKLINLLGNYSVMHHELILVSLRALRVILQKDQDNDEARTFIQNQVNKLGATKLILRLMSSRNDEIVLESLEMGIALLYGGNREVQDTIYEFLVTSSDHVFFSEVRSRIRRAVSEIKERQQFYMRKLEKKRAAMGIPIMSPSGSPPSTPSWKNKIESDEKALLEVVKAQDDDKFQSVGYIFQILRFLQLLCEGHNLELQNYLRSQTNNIKSYDLISETAAFLEALEREIDATNIDIAIQLFTTLTEYCQGPCPDNQSALIRTKLCESVNWILQNHYSGCEPQLVVELKSATLVTLLSLLEGITNPSIPRQMLNTLDFSVMKHNLNEIMQKHEHDHDMMELGFKYYFLIRTLVDYEKGDIRVFDMPYYTTFERQTGRIEIVRNDKLERVYFRIPAICKNLTTNSKKDLMWNVKRDNQQDKIEDFFDRSTFLIKEMEHRDALSKNKVFSYLALRETQLKNISFFLAVVINMLVIGSYGAEPSVRGGDVGDVQVGRGPSIAILLLGTIQAVVSGLTLIIYSVSHVPAILQQSWKTWAGSSSISYDELENNLKYKFLSAYFLMKNPLLLFYLLYVMSSILGVALFPDGPFFFAFQLLDVVARSELLKYVIRAVTLNGRSIILTALLTFVVVYLYAILGFLFFRNKFVQDDTFLCESLSMCLVNVVNYGLRSGGGIGDLLSSMQWTDKDRGWRIFYEISFFFLVIVILLNIIFGIIIDTFGELRAQNKAIENDMENRCFICGIERYTFDRQAEGFDNHITKDHNLWHYLYFIMYLKIKEKTEYTGPEQFVSECISTRLWAFVPIQKALCLDLKDEEEEERSMLLIARVEEMAAYTKKAIARLAREFTGRLDMLEDKLNLFDQKVEAIITYSTEDPLSATPRFHPSSAR